MTPEAEKGVPAPAGRWEFNADVAARFDEHVRKSVPDYDETQSLALALCDWYAPAGAVVIDWGCATGHTLKRIAIGQRAKGLALLGVDSSPAMIARANDGAFPEIKFMVGGITSEAAFTAFNFGVCLWTLQFLTPGEKRAFLLAASQYLRDGGAMFIVDKVLGSNPRAADVLAQLYHDMKLRNGLTPEEVMAKERSLRGVMHPQTVAENEEAFERAGFRHELIYRRLAFAGWILTKSP